MIYLDNAATGGRKPDGVITAVLSAVRVCANPGRSGHKLALSCLQKVQDCRNALSEVFGGYGYDRVTFTKNCTEALNLALFGVLKKGDHAVTTALEHNSVLRPLKRLKNERNVELDIAPAKDGKLSPESVLRLLKPNTKAVVVTSASNVTGYAPDLKKIRELLPERVLLIVDGAQGGGHLPLHMRETGIDCLALAGHKGLFAIQGSGALLFSERVELSPILYGGTGSMSFSLDMPDFSPDNLEAGTLAFPAVASLLEGVRYYQSNAEKIFMRHVVLTEYFIKGLKELKGFKPYSSPNPCGIVAFGHETIQSELLASTLSSRYDVAVRGGLHCAPLMHESLGTSDGGLVRASFSHFNSEAEADVLLSALRKISVSGVR